ncbi:MAG: HEAT repeat domain-containing protein [Planctomycetota bacterium]
MTRQLTRCVAIAAMLFPTARAAAQQRETEPAATVARAAVAEQVRGDAAAAESLLRAALVAAREAGRTDDARVLRQALVDLLQRQNRNDEAAALQQDGKVPAAPAPTDPLRQLIRCLDQGSRQHGNVEFAIQEIRQLGPLATRVLIDELDQLGPFGKSNVLYILVTDWNDAAREAVSSRLQRGDDRIAELIGREMRRLPASDAIQFAESMAQNESPSVRLDALAALVYHRPQDPATQALATALASSGDASVRTRAVAAIAQVHQDWARPLIEQIARDPAPSVRLVAAHALFQNLGDDEEDKAVSILEGIPPQTRGQYVWLMEGRPPEWVRAASVVAAHVGGQELRTLLKTVSWEKEPAVALPVLLELFGRDRGDNTSELRAAFSRIANSGFLAPASFDFRFASLSDAGLADAWVRLVGAAGEARILAQLDSMPLGGLLEVANSVNRMHLPWHQVVIEAFRRGETQRPVSLLDRDWTGCSQDQARILADFAVRPDAGVREALALGMRASSTPPFEPLLALLQDRSLRDVATGLAAQHAPRRLLDAMRGMQSLPEIDSNAFDALVPHFTAADLPLLLRLADHTEFLSHREDGQALMTSLLLTHGAGDVRLLELAALPTADTGWLFQRKVETAQQAVGGITREQFEPALALLPRLEQSVANKLFHRLRSLATTEHASAIAGLLRNRVAGNRPSLDGALPNTTQRLIELLVATGAADAAQTLVALVESGVDVSFAEMAAKAAIDLLANSDRPEAMLGQMLASSNVVLVQAALDSPSVAAEPTLRAQALKTVDRELAARGASSLDPSAFLKAIPRAERIAAGTHLIAACDAESGPAGILEAAIWATGDAKDVSAIEPLTRLLHHRSQSVRAAVAANLGRTFERAALVPLIELLEDDDERVSRTADSALARMKKVWETAELFK